jgi:hypothetical protein
VLLFDQESTRLYTAKEIERLTGTNAGTIRADRTKTRPEARLPRNPRPRPPLEVEMDQFVPRY